MTPQELKNSILQLAIQGKLVEQRPEEGTAEELYQQIQAEKQKLIREGKIKKEKPLLEITEEEKLFDIPESWKWVRVGSSFSTIMGQSPDGESVSENNDGIEFHQGKIFFSNYTIKNSPYKTIKPTKLAPAYSLLICVRAPVGKVNITDRKLCIGRGLSAIIPFAGITVDFLLYWFSTLENIFVKQSTGTTFKAISADIINNQPIPLPPIAEQKRIVAKIEELLPLIDRYEKAWNRLEEFNKRFPDDLQKSLLQMAIRGKLVEQRPEEGTAEELYQQIQKDKQKLIQEGKIKKEKPLPKITEEEKPFDIPDSWKWIYLSDCVYLTSGNQYEEKTTGVPYVKVADMNLPENKQEIITSTRFASDDNNGIIPIYSIIFPKRGGAISTNKKRSVLKTPIYVDSNTMGMTCTSTAMFRYLKTWFDSVDLGKLQTGTSVPQINNKDLIPLVFPLPPLAEQDRIVAKLEELLPLCEQLNKQ